MKSTAATQAWWMPKKRKQKPQVATAAITKPSMLGIRLESAPTPSTA